MTPRLEKVRQDKLREVTDGCDGTWVAHPALVPIAKAVFDEHMPTPNQYSRQRPDVGYGAKDLLDFRPEKPITESGLRANISVGIQYLGAWLAGNGCVPVFNLMEDAATAEISRSQIWQWIRSPKGVLDDGRKVTRRAVPQARRGRAAEGTHLSRRRGVAGREVRGGGKALRRDHHRRVRRVSHAARLRADRLNAVLAAGAGRVPAPTGASEGFHCEKNARPPRPFSRTAPGG